MAWYKHTNSPNGVIQDRVKDAIKNIQNFDINLLDTLQDFILSNQGKKSEYYVENIDFHNFTTDSFVYFMNQINTFRNTYHGIGPFMNNNGRWYINKDTQNLKEIIKQQQQIIESQKKQIKALKNIN